MKLNLLLCPRNSTKSGIHHMIDNDTSLSVGDLFEYGIYHYSYLDKATERIFKFSGLEKGIYKVISVNKHENDDYTNVTLQLI